MSQAIKLENFDLTSSRNNVRISQWELFAHIAEQIGNKNNYLDIKSSEGFVGLKGLFLTGIAATILSTLDSFLFVYIDLYLCCYIIAMVL